MHDLSTFPCPKFPEKGHRKRSDHAWSMAMQSSVSELICKVYTNCVMGMLKLLGSAPQCTAHPITHFTHHQWAIVKKQMIKACNGQDALAFEWS